MGQLDDEEEDEVFGWERKDEGAGTVCRWERKDEGGEDEVFGWDDLIDRDGLAGDEKARLLCLGWALSRVLKLLRDGRLKTPADAENCLAMTIESQREPWEHQVSRDGWNLVVDHGRRVLERQFWEYFGPQPVRPASPRQDRRPAGMGAAAAYYEEDPEPDGEQQQQQPPAPAQAPAAPRSAHSAPADDDVWNDAKRRVQPGSRKRTENSRFAPYQSALPGAIEEKRSLVRKEGGRVPHHTSIFVDLPDRLEGLGFLQPGEVDKIVAGVLAFEGFLPTHTNARKRRSDGLLCHLDDALRAVQCILIDSIHAWTSRLSFKQLDQVREAVRVSADPLVLDMYYQKSKHARGPTSPELIKWCMLDKRGMFKVVDRRAGQGGVGEKRTMKQDGAPPPPEKKSCLGKATNAPPPPEQNSCLGKPTNEDLNAIFSDDED